LYKTPAAGAAGTLAAFALVVVACGGSTTTVGSEVESGGVGDEISITLVGENIAFDTAELVARVGQQVTITFENRDSGVPHNLWIDGPAGPIATEIEVGAITQTLTFTIDESGTYQFLCQVHPGAMAGQLVIEG
jgi:plastocyanin